MTPETNGSKIWAWRITQALAGLCLAVVSVTTPLVVSAVTKMSQATAALEHRVTAIESTRFGTASALQMWRAVDAKADLAKCVAEWAAIHEKLNEIHRAVVRLEALSSAK